MHIAYLPAKDLSRTDMLTQTSFRASSYRNAGYTLTLDTRPYSQYAW